MVKLKQTTNLKIVKLENGENACIYIITYWCVLAGGVQSAFQQLKEYEVQLKSIVRKRFDAAVEMKNPEEITRSSNLVHVSFLVLAPLNNITILQPTR